MREQGVLSFCDIVLNSTADNSAWLNNHQEATFNQVNTPKLYSALLLDQKISEFSKDFMNKKIEELNWIFSQIREGLNKVKQAREEQENERV